MAAFRNDIGASSSPPPKCKVMPRPIATPYIFLKQLSPCKEAAREIHSSTEPRAKSPDLLETPPAGEGMKKDREDMRGRKVRGRGGQTPPCPLAASFKNKILKNKRTACVRVHAQIYEIFRWRPVCLWP